MRNRFAGTCYVCGARVEKGEGHFERHAQFVPGYGVKKFRVRHIVCDPTKKKEPETKAF